MLATPWPLSSCAGGHADTQFEQLAEIFGFGKHEPRCDGQVAGVTVVRATLPALVRDDELVIELHSKRRFSGTKIVYWPTYALPIMAVETLGVDESKKPGTKEDATEDASSHP